MIKDEKLIPKGLYCYTMDKKGKITPCPYYKILKDRPYQENGWCDFLETGDMELNRTEKWKDTKTGKIFTANEAGVSLSLLWDGCKECYINDEIDESELPKDK